MGYSLQRHYKALRVESVSKLGFLICTYWGPSDGQLSGLIPLSSRPDPSPFVIYSPPSSLRIPCTPWDDDTRMSAFKYPPTWIRFYVRVGYTTLAGDDIRRPLTLLSHCYANAECFNVKGHSSKILLRHWSTRPDFATHAVGRRRGSRERAGETRTCRNVG